MKRSTGANRTQLLFVIAAVLLPFLLALAWGAHFYDAVYYLLAFAEHILGPERTAALAVGPFTIPAASSALFALAVALPSRLGVDIALVALLLSAAGWSTSALAIFLVGRQVKRGWGGAVSALLLSFNPSLIPTLGGPASWIVACLWIAVLFLLLRRRWLALFASSTLAVLLLPWPVDASWQHVLAYLPPLFWSVFLFAAGVGVDWLSAELHRRDRARLPYQNMARLLLATVLFMVGTWQAVRIWQLFQDRPRQLWALEETTAAWVAGAMSGSDTLLAGARTGFLAGRPTAELPAASPKEMAMALEGKLQEAPVDYLVTTNELSWQQLQASVWFRLAYERVKEFRSAYVPQSPFTIWSFRQPVADVGPRHAINARVPDRLWILGYQIGPQQVQAGEVVQMVLYIQAPQATAERRSPFQVIVRLISPIDYSTVREWTVDLPQSKAVNDWEAGEVLIEPFPLELPDDLEAGAYLLNLSLLGPESAEFWPVSLDNDINRLDRFPTGYVIVPPQEIIPDVRSASATFGDDIQLDGYSIQQTSETLTVSLIWQVQGPVAEDYVAFVHLLNGAGALVANHDAVPGNGRFPTRAWQPGLTIPDTHSVPLPLNLPPGDYVLKVGLYDAESGERLPAVNAEGVQSDDSAIVLETITLP